MLSAVSITCLPLLRQHFFFLHQKHDQKATHYWKKSAIFAVLVERTRVVLAGLHVPCSWHFICYYFYASPLTPEASSFFTPSLFYEYVIVSVSSCFTLGSPFVSCISSYLFCFVILLLFFTSMSSSLLAGVGWGCHGVGALSTKSLSKD